MKALQVKNRTLKNVFGWPGWLTPVIPPLWEAKMERSLEFMSLKTAWATK